MIISKKTALIIVDMQKDFCEDGALAVPGSEEIINEINNMIHCFESAKKPIFYTRDWHPKDHCSFDVNDGIWPVHCVAESEGALFHPELYIPEHFIVIPKADTADKDAYSGFEGTSLNICLKSLKVTTLYIIGLATDYCVKSTVLDALELKFNVKIFNKCMRAVNINPEDGIKAIKDMKDSGVQVIK